jgi:NADH-quinone oxidoreductase subunit L
MTIPLMVLAVLSIITGYLGIPEFLEPMFATDSEGSGHDAGGSVVVMLLASAAGLLGIAGAYYVYVLNPSLPDRWAREWRTAYQLSLNKWYVDEAYDRSFVRPTFVAATELWKHVDVAVIDGAVNGVARAIAWGAWLLRLIQSGQMQHYVLGMALGGLVILTVFLMF